MWKTIVRRILILIPQLFILSLLIFFIADAQPGDALRGQIAPGAGVNPEWLQQERARLGLDDPWHQRYGRWMGAMLQGDFGTSIRLHRPVLDIVGERMGNTVRLAILTTILTYIIAIPLGILAARHKGRIVDKSIMVYTFVALSTPTLILGLFMILGFALGLEWFPARHAVDAAAHAAGGLTRFFSQIYHAFLPALTMALLSTVGTIYFLRGEIIDADSSDYVTTARSKGVPENKVYTRHILRNALLPVGSSFGFVLAGLFTGSIFIEQVFTFNGMGMLFVTSVRGNDHPVAFFLVMFFAILIALSALLSDIIITWLDPRIRIK
jgi:peptide/nickel transport system permease protein